MITDQSILRHMERQPHHSAGYKQLVREMGLRGDERQQLADRLRALVKSAPPHRDWSRSLHPGRTRRRSPEPDRRTPDDASRRLRLRHPQRRPAEHPRGRYLHPACGHWLGDARRPGAGGAWPPEGRWPRRRPNPARAHPRQSHRGRNLPLRLAAQLRHVPSTKRSHRQSSFRAAWSGPGGAQEAAGKTATAEIPIPSRGTSHSFERKTVGDAVLHSRHRREGPRQDRVLGNEARRREWRTSKAWWSKSRSPNGLRRRENPRGRVVEILGYEDDFGVDVEIVIRKYHLPHQFPGRGAAGGAAV